MKKQLIAMMIGLSVLATGCGGGASSEPSEPATTATEATTAAPAETTTKAPEKKSGVTAENYHKIKMDMSYDDAKKIMGSEGEVSSDSEVSGIKTTIYSWQDGLASINITVQNGEVVGKAQAGVETDTAEATMDNYNKIETGMSYDDVKKVMGGEGILMSESKIMDIESSIYAWYASDHISNCTITMQNGKVSSKAQAGLK